MYKGSQDRGVVVSNGQRRQVQGQQNRPARRPPFFCYHCNQNFPSRDVLEEHVKQISSRGASGNQNMTESAIITDDAHHGIQIEHQPRRSNLKLFCDHCDQVFTSREALDIHTAELMQAKNEPAEPDAKRQRILAEGVSDTYPMLSTVKVESGFFDLSRAEIAKIKNQSEYAAFTVDGKECYHCGDEFTSRDDLENHPRRCMRMKNANYLGKILNEDGTLEEINGAQIPNVHQQLHRQRGRRTHHQEEHEQGSLIIDQGDENADHGVVAPVEHYDADIAKTEGYADNKNWQPPVQCPLCNEYFEDRAAVRIHRYQCVHDRDLPVRKPGQPINTPTKGYCCFHCDRLFPTREELRIHVNEVNNQNLRY